MTPFHSNTEFTASPLSRLEHKGYEALTALAMVSPKEVAARQATTWSSLSEVLEESGLAELSRDIQTYLTAPGMYVRLEPNLPLFLPILLFGNAQNFYLFCLKLCQCLFILPDIMPLHVYLFCSYKKNCEQKQV